MSDRRPRVITEALGGTPLSRRLQDTRDTTAWVVPHPANSEAWTARATSIAREFAGSNWLAPLEAAFALGSDSAARARLRRVASNGIVVTTGQQPGLFGGPMYTFSKALSALALADAIESATGVPTAPVFWAATDDSDFEEACWTATATPGGADKIRVGASAGDGVPMAWTPLGDPSDALRALRRAAGSVAYAKPLAAAEQAYTKDATVGGAYVALLRGLLEPLGIAVLDATHDAVRRVMDPVARRALARATDVESALEIRERALEAAGFEPQVKHVKGLSLVFGYEGESKHRVPHTLAAARAEQADAGTLGPNVLLRPVAERAILPTIAYVAGPAELAYFAQSVAVADALEFPRPFAVPRWSGTVIEPHVARLLEKYALTVEEVRAPHVAARKLAATATPAAATSALAAARDDVGARLTALEATAEGLLGNATIEGVRRDVNHRLDRIERRLRAAVKRRETALMRDLGTLEGALAPFGKRPERVLNFLPLWARNGEDLINEMLQEAARHAALIVAPQVRSDETNAHPRPA